MLIKKIAIGNKQEAFIEDRISNSVNVLFSDDNNRGKTIVIQGLMHSLGYSSIFPTGFNFEDFYFYSHIEISGQNIEILRHRKTFIVKSEEYFQVFSTVRDFRYFFDENLIKFPRIWKDDHARMVDFDLFYELFFIGQDNRSPSRLITNGKFKKNDFKNMLYSIKGVEMFEQSAHDIEDLKLEIKAKKSELSVLRKKLKIIRANPRIAEQTSVLFSSEQFQLKEKRLAKLNDEISKLKRSLYRESNRLHKLQSLMTELKSLNRDLKEGLLICGDCNSDKIIYKNKDITFDVSNREVRRNILESIRKNITQIQEKTIEISEELSTKQQSLSSEIASSPVNWSDAFVFKDIISSGIDVDKEAERLLKEISSYGNRLEASSSKQISGKDRQKEILNDILSEMLRLYKIVDPSGNLSFSDLFTKSGVTFSGSDGAEYYFSRLLAQNNIIEHDFPLIVDSFRSGELSSRKADKMIELYKGLGKQVILTATLKDEEYAANKYSSDQTINSIDYSEHQDSKILQGKYAIDFLKILNRFEGVVV